MRNRQWRGWRLGRSRVAVPLLSLLFCLPAARAQHSPTASPHFSPGAPSARQTPQTVPARPGQAPAQGWNQTNQPQSRGEHLPQWMANHQNLNPAQQEEALRREPGFSRLPQQQQQQLIDRLHKLDNAPPQVRQRILARNEMFERLPAQQKQAIRGASQALSQMPPDRNMAVRHAFRDLRGLPPDQRVNVLNSARFQAEFSPQERTILGNLLSIEPYQP